MKKIIDFKFPCEYPHEGIPLANGNFGALVWGEKNILHLTINRQDYWNHSGKICWGNNASYEKARDILINTPAKDLKNYESNFIAYEKDGMPNPTRMPVGRFDLIASKLIKNAYVVLDLGFAILNSNIRAFVDPENDILYVEDEYFQISPVPNTSSEVTDYRKKYNLPAPEFITHQKIKGWTQNIPGDLSFCAAAVKKDYWIMITTALAENQFLAFQKVQKIFDEADHFENVLKKTKEFYSDYFGKSPQIEISHENHQELYSFGLFKLSGFTRLNTPAPTLQGPWIEDYRMPPWQCDYHFNVNLQMAHWPMLSTNHPEQFQPLIKMIKSWFPIMRDYAEKFIGEKDAFMLPHACDDRGYPADTNWKCQFDPGSAGWASLLLWRYYRYFENKHALTDTIFPFMRGALKLYQKMLEKSNDYSLYASSPEYISNGGFVWGKNPSFHLAIIHSLSDACIKAAEILGDNSEISIWQKIKKNLPKANIKNDEILIWDELPLRESHRHHSHLACIYPFDIFDMENEQETKIVKNSLFQWTKAGTGNWTGWSTAWAAIIWARMRNPQATFYMLDQLQRFFTGKNHYHTHDAIKMGFTSFCNESPPHIMQMDATCGALTAILEMIAHKQGEKIRIAPAIPPEWGDVKFERIRLPGNKSVSGEFIGGKIKKFEIASDIIK